MDSRPVGLDRRNPPPEGRGIAADIIAGLEEFTAKLESGEPIPVTVVRQRHTPDGPVTTFSEGVLFDQQRRRDFARTVWLCCVLAMGLAVVAAMLLS